MENQKNERTKYNGIARRVLSKETSGVCSDPTHEFAFNFKLTCVFCKKGNQCFYPGDCDKKKV